MVTIPSLQDPTLEEMRRVTVEQDAKQPRRTYLGASEIGNPCARAVWYNFQQAPRKERRAELIWAAEDGHATELVIAKRLRMIKGIELWTHKEDGSQWGYSILEGKQKGHCDGIIRGLLQAPKTVHVWENKAKNEKGFADFQKKKATFGEKRVLREWSEQYFAQAQILMHYMEMTRHYTTVALAGGRDIDSCRTEYDKEYALALIDKAQKIIEAKEPPKKISEKSEFWLCRWCDFEGICHK